MYLATKGMTYYSHWGPICRLSTVRVGESTGSAAVIKLWAVQFQQQLLYITARGQRGKLKYCGRVQPQLSGIKTCSILSVKSSSGSHGSRGVKGHFTTNQFSEMRKEAGVMRRGGREIRRRSWRLRTASIVERIAMGHGMKRHKTYRCSLVNHHAS